LKAWVSCDKTKAFIEVKRPNSVAQPFSHHSQAYVHTHMRLDGIWTESLKLQAWGSLMVQTWSQYLQYFFVTSLWKSRSTSTPSGQLAREVVEYWYSVHTESVKHVV
jgi:hypothetical protein